MDLKLVLTPPKRRRTEKDSEQRTNPIEEEAGKQSCLIHFDLYEKETKTRSFTAKSWD